MTKRKPLFIFARAAMTLLVMLLTTATAWAEDNVSYFDPTAPVGQQSKTRDGVTVINNENKPEGTIGIANQTTWYVVERSVSYTSDVTFIGNVNLILSDDAELIINCNTDEMCIYVLGNLNIYAQSNGDRQGTISTINSSSEDGIYAEADISIYGGSVVLTGESHGIYTENNINIYGGSVTARGTYYANGIGIKSYGGNITINGGQVTAVGEGGSGIEASRVTINGGIVTATGEYGINSYDDIIINGGTIEATGTGNNANGIYSYVGNIKITGGTLTAMGGIFNDTSSGITISGGKVTANGENDGISSFGDIIIDGGDITATVTGEADNASGIWTFGGDITITGGTVYATATGNKGNGLCSGLYYGEGGNIILSGGTIIAIGNKSGIYAFKSTEGDGTITLNGGTVYASSYSGNVAIAEGLILTDGNTTYTGPYTFNTEEALNAIAGKALSAPTCDLTANLAEGNYWTTFYCGYAGYKISETINAWAYTATASGSTITMHMLGKVIPQGTAVVIVAEGDGSDTSINLTLDRSNNVAENNVENNLHGVDVATSLKSLKDTYSADALLMLSNKNNHFGFHEVALTNVPARKAFLPINSTEARSLNIVFEDGNTTGIKALNRDERIVNSEDAWFDLQGRKIQMPTQRGLYIHNGKKIVVK